MKLLPWDEYQRVCPKKRMSSAAMIWNEEDRLLLLRPSYKDYWLLPGGVISINESPRQAAEREIKEEIGLDIKITRLLAVNYNFAVGDDQENLQWIFYGGVLSKKQIRRIRVDGDEIIDFRWVKISETDRLMKKDMTARMRYYKKAKISGMAIYLEDWKNVKRSL